MTQRLYLFATAMDYAELLPRVEEAIDIKYVRTGLLESPDVCSYSGWSSIPNLGISSRGEESDEEYLVVPREMEVTPVKVPQHRGGVRYEVGDQTATPASVLFQPGGLFGRKAVVQGLVATISDHPLSKRIFSAFRRETRRCFERVDMYWLGPDTSRRFSKGARLTQDVGRSKEFDLRRP